MAIIPMIVATLCYVWTAFTFAIVRDWPMAGVFAAYAAANVCLIIVAFRTV